VGAGGAGSAIAHALVDAGVSELALHDADDRRREVLAAKLRRYGQVPITMGSADPAGFALACNATPMGMKPDDPLPLQVGRLDAGAAVGDVVTVPAVPPLIEQARARGHVASTGSDMFAQVRVAIVDFLLEKT
jgi:shikimate dehydrogenase